MRDDTILFQIAAAQAGLISRSQLRELGYSRSGVSRRINAGALRRVTTRVFEAAGAPATRLRRCWLSILDVDGVLSYSPAMAWWGLPGFNLDPTEVTRLRGGRRQNSNAAIVHDPRLLKPSHVTTFEDVPITTPARTIFDLAGVVHPGKVERALDTAWARRLVNARSMREMLRDLAQKGRSGIRVMRALLEVRDDDYRPPESGLESRFQAVCREARLGEFVRQINVGNLERWIARTDFRHEVLPLLVFIDSDLHHTALLDGVHDDEQTIALREAGFVVVRVTESEVWHQPKAMVRKVRAAEVTARNLMCEAG
jgi:very-short-patch-repair endonuclease